MLEYGIELEAKDTEKSSWKKYVKEHISQRTENDLRNRCEQSTKSRFVQHDKYEPKKYLCSKMSLRSTKKILRARLNMSSIPGNYKGRSEGLCPFCETKEGSTEHYFKCKIVRQLKGVERGS